MFLAFERPLRSTYNQSAGPHQDKAGAQAPKEKRHRSQNRQRQMIEAGCVGPAG